MVDLSADAKERLEVERAKIEGDVLCQLIVAAREIAPYCRCDKAEDASALDVETLHAARAFLRAYWQRKMPTLPELGPPAKIAN